MTVTDYLQCWKDGAPKAAILDFVRASTTKGSGFVELVDRIATFDNDGTLWVEKPAPPQADFVIRAWEKALTADPSLCGREPWKALAEHDEAFFNGLATQDPAVVASLEEAIGRTWAGTTPEMFDAEVRDWLNTVTQPKFKVAYTKLVFKPMLELFDLLKANDFRILVCSGGGRDFMRVFAEETWGIYKEDVIGTAATYRASPTRRSAKPPKVGRSPSSGRE